MVTVRLDAFFVLGVEAVRFLRSIPGSLIMGVAKQVVTRLLVPFTVVLVS